MSRFHRISPRTYGVSPSTPGGPRKAMVMNWCAILFGIYIYVDGIYIYMEYIYIYYSWYMEYIWNIWLININMEYIWQFSYVAIFMEDFTCYMRWLLWNSQLGYSHLGRRKDHPIGGKNQQPSIQVHQRWVIYSLVICYIAIENGNL